MSIECSACRKPPEWCYCRQWCSECGCETNHMGEAHRAAEVNAMREMGDERDPGTESLAYNNALEAVARWLTL